MLNFGIASMKVGQMTNTDIATTHLLAASDYSDTKQVLQYVDDPGQRALIIRNASIIRSTYGQEGAKNQLSDYFDENKILVLGKGIDFRKNVKIKNRTN